MALKPSEAFSGKDVAAQVRWAEERIDAELKAQGAHRGEGPLTIAVDLRWNAAVVAELLKRYQAAGWAVERVSDQRDGDYLRFEARKAG